MKKIEVKHEVGDFVWCVRNEGPRYVMVFRFERQVKKDGSAMDIYVIDDEGAYERVGPDRLHASLDDLLEHIRKIAEEKYSR